MVEVLAGGSNTSQGRLVRQLGHKRIVCIARIYENYLDAEFGEELLNAFADYVRLVHNASPLDAELQARLLHPLVEAFGDAVGPRNQRVSWRGPAAAPLIWKFWGCFSSRGARGRWWRGFRARRRRCCRRRCTRFAAHAFEGVSVGCFGNRLSFDGHHGPLFRVR